MRRDTAGARRPAYLIGLGYGLVAGLVGVAQWTLTMRDLAARLAEFEALRRKYPGFEDATNVVRGNQWYWLGTATLGALVALALCLLAAFTAARALRRPRDGWVAAWVAAALSGAIYVAATFVADRTSPAPYVTEDFLPCELPLGVVFFCFLFPLALLAAHLGGRAGGFFSRGRHAL